MNRLLLILILFFYSCVPQSDYQKLQDENQELKESLSSSEKQLEKLQVELNNANNELEEFQLSPSILIKEIQEGMDNNDFTNVKSRIDILTQKHPNAPETNQARIILASLEEEESWQKASSSESIYDYKSYVKAYPNGKYSLSAKQNISRIRTELEKKQYTEAINSNSSAKMKNFLKNYPNHPQSYNIRQKIIRAEVEEIKGDRRTGQLPESQRIGNGYSANSSITIRNDTDCELTVRYSGPDAKVLTISAGGTASVYLKSGTYDVASTACNLNYAGSEVLQGQYSSSYYIVSSLY